MEGQLDLGSVERAADVLLAATKLRHQQLFSHSLQHLEAHVRYLAELVHKMMPLGNVANALEHVLIAAINDNSSNAPSNLQALLAGCLSDAFAYASGRLGSSTLLALAAQAQSCWAA